MLKNFHQQFTQPIFFSVIKHSTIFFLYLFSYHLCIVKAADNQFLYGGCSQGNYQLNSLFETNHNSLLSSIVSSSSQVLYNSFALGNDTASPDGAIFGLYQCRGDLKTRDCSACVASAVSEIGLVCPNTYGAMLQLQTCFIRYEHLDFLQQQLDTTLRYKKCSKSVSNDVEFLRRRDNVLGDMQAAPLGFKISISGSVEGFAQCQGDLSPTDCSSCLADAVEKLKNLCGSAKAADVFLAQCYARYWASGYYDSSTSSDSSNKDDVGKMVAIIVGAVAGVAVVIVFLSLCRKAIG